MFAQLKSVVTSSCNKPRASAERLYVVPCRIVGSTRYDPARRRIHGNVVQLLLVAANHSDLWCIVRH